MITALTGKYSILINSDNLPVYLQPWYLDVVCGVNKWTVIELLNTNNTVDAIWVSNTSKKMGLSYDLQAQLTPYSGLHVLENNVSHTNIKKLLSYVKGEYRFISADLHYDNNQYFTELTARRTTYIIPSNSQDVAWQSMKSDYRRKIKKAKVLYAVKEISFDKFWHLLATSFTLKNKPNPFPRALTEQLFKACLKNKSLILLGAFDSEDQLVGVASFLKDNIYTFYMGGGNIDKDNSMYLLLWQGIEQCMKDGLSFDFEGSSIPSIAQFFKGFGGNKKYYIHFTHYQNRLVKGLVGIKTKWL